MIRLFLGVAVALALVSFGQEAANSQTAADFHFKFTEKPGLYGVGLRVVEQYDQSRIFQIESTSTGNVDAIKGPRPLQTLIWYPAEQSSRETMTFGDYGDFIKTETSFGKSNEHGKPQSFVAAFMSGTTDLHAWAVKDAEMQAGRFPVVIYAPSVNAPATENIELCEYLASKGFVVVASPSMGALSRTMTVDLPGADAEAKDISFLIDFARGLPDTDISKVAAVGYSWGGMAALFASSRDRRIGALVSLDGSFRYSPETVEKAGDIHPEQMTIPLLVFSRAEEPLESWDAMRQDKSKCVTAASVLNEWTYGDLLHIHLLGISHIQFSSLYQRSERFRKEGLQFVPADYSLQEGADSYNWMVRYVSEFLSAYLKQDRDSLHFLARMPAGNGVPRHLLSANFRHASAKDAKVTP
jgi:dienelactone hydrolase